MVIATKIRWNTTELIPCRNRKMDRFLIRARMGIPKVTASGAILRSEAGAAKLDEVQPVLTAAEVLSIPAGSGTSSR